MCVCVCVCVLGVIQAQEYDENTSNFWEGNKKINSLNSTVYVYSVYTMEVQMHVYMGTIQCKVMFCPVHATNAYKESIGTAPLILNNGTRWS